MPCCKRPFLLPFYPNERQSEKKDTVKTYLDNYILTRPKNSRTGVNTVRATHFAKKCGMITNNQKIQICIK